MIAAVGGSLSVLDKGVGRFVKQGLGGAWRDVLLAHGSRGHPGGFDSMLAQHLLNWVQEKKKKDVPFHSCPPPKSLPWPLHSNKVFSCVGTVSGVLKGRKWIRASDSTSSCW